MTYKIIKGISVMGNAVSSRIWTRVSLSNSHDINSYTNRPPWSNPEL